MTVSEIEEWTRSEIWLEALGFLDLDIEVQNLIADWKAMREFIQRFIDIPWDDLPLRQMEERVLAEDVLVNLRLKP